MLLLRMCGELRGSQVKHAWTRLLDLGPNSCSFSQAQTRELGLSRLLAPGIQALPAVRCQMPLLMVHACAGSNQAPKPPFACVFDFDNSKSSTATVTLIRTTSSQSRSTFACTMLPAPFAPSLARSCSHVGWVNLPKQLFLADCRIVVFQYLGAYMHMRCFLPQIRPLAIHQSHTLYTCLRPPHNLFG